MTVSTIAAPVIYAGNGVTASFSFSYVFFSQADILVQLTTVGTGVVTTSTLGGLGTYDYTVAGVQDVATGEYQSGSIVMNSAPPFGVNIALIPNTPMTQGASFSNAGPLPAKAVESALDRVMLAAQRAVAALQSALRLPQSDPAATVLPSAALRASRVLGFDPAGNVTVMTQAANLTDASYASVTTSGMSVARMLNQRMLDHGINLLDAGGAVGGVDCGPAFRAAMSMLIAAGGGKIILPVGRFFLLSASAFTMPAAACRIKIEGAGQGATELVWPSATSGLVFTWNSLLNAVSFSDMSFTTQQASGGSAIQFLNTQNYGGFVEDTQKHIERCTFQGDGGTNAGWYWTAAVNIQAVNYVRFPGCLFYGGVVAGARVGIGVTLADYAGIITATFIFDQCYFIDMHIGVQTYNNPQGVNANGGGFVDCDYGIWTTGTVGLVGLQVQNCNFACYYSAVYTQNEVDDLQLIGNTSYVYSLQALYPSFNISKVARFTIDDNDFICPAFSYAPAIQVDVNSGWPGTIGNNLLSGPFQTGINLTANSSLIEVAGNNFGNTVVNRVVNAGASNSIDELQAWTPVLKFGGSSTGITGTFAGTITKSGRTCIAEFRITLTSKGSATGVATVTGFTFGTPGVAAGECGYYTNVSGASGLTGYLGGGTFNFTIPSATGITAAADTNFTNTTDVIVTVSYVATP